jgi:Lon protease-like protein
MEEIGLFPLGMVLLPGERAPLHIFEERYKELIGECVAQDRPFGLVYADDDGTRSTGTKAAVLDVLHRFPDGRMNIVVEGRERFTIVRRTTGRSFDTAEIEPFEDEPGSSPDSEQVEACLEAFGDLAELADSELPDLDPADPQLSFDIAGRVEFEASAKQELLESRSERDRLERLLELLDDAAETLRFQKLARERAAGNGQVEEA